MTDTPGRAGRRWSRTSPATPSVLDAFYADYAVAEETLWEEHARLLRETEALRRDHAALESARPDMPSHREHRIRLQKQIDALHDHIDRIKREAPDGLSRPK